MTDSPEQPSDEELSELIDDEEKIVDDETEQNDGGVEVGIPPAINDDERTLIPQKKCFQWMILNRLMW